MHWIAAELQGFIPEVRCPLDYRDAFSLLVAVMLSAQCTDARVNQTTPALLAAAPTPEAMAALGETRIREFIQHLGLAGRKATALAELSRLLVERHGSQVPATLDALTSLPGIGRKTALVVLGEIFHLPTFPVDTHIARLARRWGISQASNPEKIEADLMAFFPGEDWHALHLRMILYARQYCTARGCDGTTCPICRMVRQRGL